MTARTAEIIDTIRKCPSGALSYSINDIEYRNPNEREPWAEGASKEHYTLQMRCFQQ
jgi:Divergent 4Fe-4S mono-cluster